MASTQRIYHRIGTAMVVIGVFALVAAVTHEYFGYALFGDPPFVLGVAFVIVGAVLMRGITRDKKAAPNGV